MKFDLDDDQAVLRDSVRRLLAAHYLPAERAAWIEGRRGTDAPLWSRLAEFGILGATLPQSSGGIGGGPVEAMIVMGAIGAAQVVQPYLETAILCGAILKRCDTAEARAILIEIVEGNAMLSLAAHEPGPFTTRATRIAGGWSLTGAKPVVHSAPDATHLIISALVKEKFALFVVERHTAGLTLYNYTLADGRSAADLVIAGLFVPDTALLATDGRGLLDAAIDEAIAALCAEATAIMAEMLRLTVEHLGQRRQFGQPLAGFQALQHKAAEMYMALDRATSAMHLASHAVSEPAETRKRLASAAKVTISDSMRLIGETCVQLYGGIGFVDDLPHSVHYKRLLVIDATLGGKAFHLARYRTLANADH
ncbi:MAG: acyl-CoA dehydrogenase [Pseudomonadota bacterium]